VPARARPAQTKNFLIGLSFIHNTRHLFDVQGKVTATLMEDYQKIDNAVKHHFVFFIPKIEHKSFS
jgi:hypothetical protein